MSTLLAKPCTNMSETGRFGIGRRESSGMTVLELLVALAIVAILTMIAFPSLTYFTHRANIAKVVSHLSIFATAFRAYEAQFHTYPNDSDFSPPDHFPPGSDLEDTIPLAVWSNETPLGGHYDWEGPDVNPYAGIALSGTTAPETDLE